MRESCIYCIAKHVSKAIILLCEAKLGHPIHKYLAMGNLSEAEDESVHQYPDLGGEIREIRLKIEKDIEEGVKLTPLLQKIIKIIEGKEKNEKKKK